MLKKDGFLNFFVLGRLIPHLTWFETCSAKNANSMNPSNPLNPLKRKVLS